MSLRNGTWTHNGERISWWRVVIGFLIVYAFCTILFTLLLWILSNA